MKLLSSVVFFLLVSSVTWSQEKIDKRLLAKYSVEELKAKGVESYRFEALTESAIELRKKLVIYLILCFTARFRPLWLLKTVRVFYNLSDFNFLIHLYDPNVIRKRINYRFQEKIVVVKLKEGGRLLVDINDHIGWRIFMIGVFARRAIASVRNAIIPPESSKIAGT